MNTHEYQAKEILRQYDIPVPEGEVVSSSEQVEAAIKRHNLEQALVKVQVHTGGRGKAGGVKFAKTREEILEKANELLGKKIVTNQTGPEGLVAHELLLYAPEDIEKEFYVGATMDRKNAQAVLIVSPEGGMEIEEVAAKTPEKVLTLPIRFDGYLHKYQRLRVAKFMGWEGALAKQGMDIIAKLAKVFIETDASLLEINPLVQTPEGKLIAVDAKLSIDDNALFRQPKLKDCYDPTQLPEAEVRANENDLAYVALDGSIGCMVNGAGLAMATMDIIDHFGGQPANFLDVGGSATEEKVAEGFKIILSDSKVKAILVNIFGGIMNCATLAGGIIAASQQVDLHVPLIVRMEGTNVEEGKKMLRESGLNITVAEGLEEAASKAVDAAKA